MNIKRFGESKMKRSELKKIIEDYCPLKQNEDEPCKTEKNIHCVYCESLINKLIKSGFGTSKPLISPKNPYNYKTETEKYNSFELGVTVTFNNNFSGAFQPIEQDEKEDK
jgi:hypothetical protein